MSQRDFILKIRENDEHKVQKSSSPPPWRQHHRDASDAEKTSLASQRRPEDSSETTQFDPNSVLLVFFVLSHVSYHTDLSKRHNSWQFCESFWQKREEYHHIEPNAGSGDKLNTICVSTLEEIVRREENLADKTARAPHSLRSTQKERKITLRAASKAHKSFAGKPLLFTISVSSRPPQRAPAQASCVTHTDTRLPSSASH